MSRTGHYNGGNTIIHVKNKYGGKPDLYGKNASTSKKKFSRKKKTNKRSSQKKKIKNPILNDIEIFLRNYVKKRRLIPPKGHEFYTLVKETQRSIINILNPYWRKKRNNDFENELIQKGFATTPEKIINRAPKGVISLLASIFEHRIFSTERAILLNNREIIILKTIKKTLTEKIKRDRLHEIKKRNIQIPKKLSKRQKKIYLRLRKYSKMRTPKKVFYKSSELKKQSSSYFYDQPATISG